VAHITISFTPTSATSKLVCFATAPVGVGGNDMFSTGIFHDGNCIAYAAGNGYSADADSGTNIGIANSTNTSARNITFRGIGSNAGSNLVMGNYRSNSTLQMTSGVYGSLTIMEIEP